jgi:fructosamine-3-kinase
MPDGHAQTISQWLAQYSFTACEYTAIKSDFHGEIACVKTDKQHWVVKLYRGDAAAEKCHSEVRALEILNDSTSHINSVNVANICFYKGNVLALEFINSSTPVAKNWFDFGTGLATMHATGSASKKHNQFGFYFPTFCGPTLQKNDFCANGVEFFCQQRLVPLANHCQEKNLLNQRDLNRVSKLCDRLPHLIPASEPSLLHGDLWSGNVIFDTRNQGWLIDPAAYFGWPEAELAMTLLFGGFDREFYRGYELTSNIDKDWRERAPIYNLYHLLNHLLIFGESYLSAVQSVLDRFVGRQ